MLDKLNSKGEKDTYRMVKRRQVKTQGIGGIKYNKEIRAFKRKML